MKKLITVILLSNIKAPVFFEKHIKNKYLCRNDKNYFYLPKSNIPVVDLIVGSRSMIEVSKKYLFV